MATVRKLTVTRYVVPHPTKPKKWKQVPKGTEGAVKRAEKTGTYFVVDKSVRPAKRINTHCTDLRAAQAVAKFFWKGQPELVVDRSRISSGQKHQ